MSEQTSGRENQALSENQKICLLVLGGEIRDADLFLERLNAADAVIAADSGARHLLSLGRMPEQVFGDMDSLTEDEVERLESSGCRLTVSPAEKNDTDGSFVIREALKRGFGEIRIWGALGKWPDHSYANIMLLQLALMPEYRQAYGPSENDMPEIVIEDAGIRIFLAKRGKWIEGKTGGFLSIFSLTPEVTGFRQTGLKYQPEGDRFTSRFPLGISNEFIQDGARLDWDEGVVLCMQIER